MSIGKLLINAVELNLSTSIVFPISYSIADIKEPQNLKGNSTKEIKLPGTKTNKAFFSSAFNLSITDDIADGIGFDFDPTLRYPAQYYQRGHRIFNGAASLKYIEVAKDVYHFFVVLYGEAINIFQLLGDVGLAELGWDEYNHTLNVTNIQNSWSAAHGSGYWWPLIDYGYATNPFQYQTNWLMPCVYWKEVWEKAFERVGYTIDSTFFNTALFKSFVVANGGGERVLLTAAEVAERQCLYTADGLINRSFDTPYNTATVLGSNDLRLDYQFNDQMYIGDTRFIDSTISVDALLQFDENGAVLTVANSGSYNLAVAIYGDYTFGWVGGTIISDSISFSIIFTVKRNGAVVVFENKFVVGALSGSGTLDVTVSQDLQLIAGDELIFGYQIVSTLNGLHARVAEIADAPTSFDYSFDLDDSFSFDLTSIQSDIVDGDTVHLSTFLPNIKAKDFLIGTMRACKLYMSEPSDDGVIKIEPLETFYEDTDNAVVWTDKLDNSKKMRIEAASNIEGKNYVFKFAEDLDWFKQDYYNRHGVHYGDYVYEVPSTFKKGNRTFEVPFAQTIPAQLGTSDIIIPRIISMDTATQVVKPYKGKTRVFINQGVISSDGWELINSGTLAATALTSYPRAHHLDDLTTPTFDLNFGAVLELYYTATAYTTANLFSTYHETFIREITGRDSKLVNAYFKLNEGDLFEGFMRYLVNLRGTLFRINTIKDFNGNEAETTKVELSKVLKARSPKTFIYGGGNMVRSANVPAGFNGGGTRYGGSQKTTNADVTINKDFGLYMLDTTAKVMILTLETDYRIGQLWELKNTTNTNIITINATGGLLIDGLATVNIPAATNITRLYFNGTGFNIL